MPVALGKKPAVSKPSDLKLTSFLIALPPLPSKRFGYGTLFTDWRMLGNDYVGDCVFASADHQTMLWNKLAGHPVSFTKENTLADYSAVTGYNPKDPNSDQGTVVQEALSYRRKTGVIDSNGKRHKIDAYARIPAGNFSLMLRCVWTFGAVEIGFEVPSSALDQWHAGEVWDDVGDSNIEGGHDVPIVGSMDPTTECSCITWRRKQRMTKRFYERYNDEAWVPLSFEQMTAAGFNVRHIDQAGLKDALSRL